MNQSHKLHTYDGSYKYDREVAQTYDESRQTQRHWLREEKFIKSYIRNHRVNSLLDLPVGTGRFLQHYAGIPRVVGVDISSAMLAVAEEKLSCLNSKVKAQLEQGDVFALRFKDVDFDAVIVFRLFHLLPAVILSPAIKELCRITRRDIIAQTYAPLNRLRSLTRKLKNGLQNKTFSPQSKVPQKPWCHIKAYNHKQDLIDSHFKEFGFFASTAKLLDIYDNSQVRVTIYSRQVT